MDLLVTEHNWAGNYGYQASDVVHPGSLEELQARVAGATKIRALGSRHSFNDLADSPGSLVVLDRFGPSICVDERNMTVSVSGGTRYGKLAGELECLGFALHNLASLPHISVAGAVATATHGSGDTNGNLATAVSALEMVTAGGSIVNVRRGDVDFDGMLVGLGALGIVTRLTLDIEPSFRVGQTVFEGLDWDQVLENFDQVTSAAYSVSLFTDWAGSTVDQVWLKSRVGDAVTDVPSAFYGATPALAAMHPLPGVPGSNCTQQLGVSGPWSDRLAHFRMEFTPSQGDELQSEYLIGREHAVAALGAMRRLSDVLAPLLLISEVRTIAADPLWLSPSYGRDSVGLHFTWRPDQPAVEGVLTRLEAELAPFAARPHWGKLFTSSAGDLAPFYPRLGSFTALADRMDPAGKFRNSFLERTVFGK